MTKRLVLIAAFAAAVAIGAWLKPMPAASAAPPMTFQVITTNNLGPGSLREAMMNSNANAGLDTIVFNIPGPAPHTITLATPLPIIDDAVIIDGTTQPGTMGTPSIEINGNALVVDGLTVNAGPTTVRGLVINRFGGAGIFVRSGNGTTIAGNFIGTDVAGTAPLPNTGAGVSISPLSFGTTVGGPGAGNVIGFNAGNGVAVSDDSSGNLIRGNSILSNGLLGIDLGPDGVTPNDAGDPDTGANGRQNFPVLTAAGSVGTTVSITGTLNSKTGTTYTLEFFSSVTCDPSGFGEGARPLGTTVVTTNAAGSVSFSVSLPVAVAAGEVITATATDVGGNTSELSACVTVIACTLTCPPGPVASTPPSTSSGCGVAVSFPLPDTSGACGAVTCAPPSGSFFPVGATVVLCTAMAGPGCAFTVTVLDKTAPALTCPVDIVAPLPLGSTTVTVTYAVPIASDNCAGLVPVTCMPPSGSSFGIGVTPVTCAAADSAGNASMCTFRVFVGDVEPPRIICPANISMQLPRGQCSSAVTYPPPTVSDNLPGATAVCAPLSGSTFPVGVTTITCTATDAAGNRASCAFTITLIGLDQVKLTPEGERPLLDFDKIAAAKKSGKNLPSKALTVANTGCVGTRLTLSFRSLLRMGADVDNGKIRDPDDRGLYPINAINANGSETPVVVGSPGEQMFTVDAGQQRSFRVFFDPLIPGFAGKATDLAASQVRPSVINSKLTMPNSAGAALVIDLIGRLTTDVRLINFKNPRKQKRADFEQSGDEFTITYALFDSNLDVDHATYEFLDSKNEPVEDLFVVDLVQPIKDSKILVGQSFLVVQKFVGALTNPAIVSVRITVVDRESKDSITVPVVVVSKTSANSAAAPRSGEGRVDLPALTIRGRRKR